VLYLYLLLRGKHHLCNNDRNIGLDTGYSLSSCILSATFASSIDNVSRAPNMARVSSLEDEIDFVLSKLLASPQSETR
jgi:hypothetical protein